MKLTSMTYFVLQQEKELKGVVKRDSDFNLIFNYAKFLKQPLTLGMFVPCDEDGNLVTNPKDDDSYQWDIIHDKLVNYEGYSRGSEKNIDLLCEKSKEIHIQIYQQAKERVLFESVGLEMGFIVNYTNNGFKSLYSAEGVKLLELNIEDLVKHNLTLTKTAIKQLVL